MKKIMLKFISGLAMLALTLLSYTSVSATYSGAESSLASNTYYVSPTGNDINACTLAAPCKTFTRAMNLAAVGDTVIIAAGTYQEQVTISKPLTLKAAGIVKTLGFIIRADNVTIDGFDITSPKTSSGFGVRVYNANCKILNNYIHDTWWDGILLEGTSSNCLVSGNKIERASQSGAEVRGNNHTIQFNEVLDTLQTPPGSTFTRSQGADADGFRFFGGGHQFIGNYIHDIKGGTSTNPDPHTDCFQSWKDSAPRLQAHDILFKNNKCFLSWDNNQASSSKVFQFGNVINSIVEGNVSRTRMASIVQDGSHDITFINNTFIGDGSLSWGIEINTSTYNFTVRDNIFYHQENGYGYLIVKSGVTGVDAGHNCVDATTRTPAGSPRPGDVWGKDPLFVNYLADDFQLQPNSPCAGIGAYISSSPTAMPSPTPTSIGTSTSIPVTITSSPTPTTIVSSPTLLPTNTPQATATSVPATTTPTVAPTEPPAPSETVYDQTDVGFVYSPEWRDISNIKTYGGTYKETYSNGASATFTFSGQSFSVLYTGGPAFRNMDVYVDDVLVGTITQKVGTRTYQLRWDYTGQLSPGTHTLKLVFATTNATGTKGSIDAVIVR